MSYVNYTITLKDGRNMQKEFIKGDILTAFQNYQNTHNNTTLTTLDDIKQFMQYLNLIEYPMDPIEDYKDMQRYIIIDADEEFDEVLHPDIRDIALHFSDYNKNKGILYEDDSDNTLEETNRFINALWSGEILAGVPITDIQSVHYEIK